MRRSRSIRPRASAHARALVLGLAWAAVHPAAGAAGASNPMPLVLAQVSGIPTSPSFRMNLSPGLAADLAPPAPIGSHDVPAKSASAARPASASASAPAVAARPAASAARSSLAAASAAATAPAALDPFEHLRERLAQTLGATPSGPNGKYVLRVSNRGESGDNVVSAAHADRVAALAPRKSPRPATAASEAPRASTGWDYAGANGPEAWSRLQPGFEACGTGARQSPIDIRDGIAVELEPIRFDYRAGAFTVVDTGHTVQVDVAPGSGITVQGHRYELEQFHFHRPSEERIDGRRFDMTVHLVHRDAQGRLAVVAVLLERGSAQPVIQAVWNNLPLEKNEPVQASGTLDPARLLPDDRRYYTYMGSLTTPPCTEGVLWMVMQQPVQLSSEQDAIFAHLYPMNARPLQAASGRLIKASE